MRSIFFTMILVVLCSCVSRQTSENKPISKTDAQFTIVEPVKRAPASGPMVAKGVKGQTEPDFIKDIRSKNMIMDKLTTGVRLKKLFATSRSRSTEFFKQLRREEPVFVLPGYKGKDLEDSIPTFVVLSKYKDVKEVLDNNKVFSVRPYSKIMDATVGSPYMLGRDLTYYNDEKAPMRLAVGSPQNAERIRQIIATKAKEAIYTGIKNGEIDIVKSVTRAVPIGLNEDYFGFTGPSPKALAKWSRATQHAFFHNPFKDKDVDERSVEAGNEMRAYIRDQLIPQRKKELENGRPTNDVVSRVLSLSKTHERFGVSDERVVANIIGLLVGSVETTSAAISQSVEIILSNPSLRELAIKASLENNNDLISKITWEALRFNPVNPWLARYVEQDYTIATGTKNETLIKKGSVVLASTESAMFDEEVFENPDQFKLNRDQSLFMHLGYANHVCLGDDVSLIMVPETVKQILTLKNVKIDDRRSQSRKVGIDKKDGPFPESFYLKFDSDPKPVQVEDTREKIMNYLKLEGFIVEKLKNMDRREEAQVAITGAIFGDEKSKLKATYALPELIVDAMSSYTDEQKTEACLNKNPKSKDIFPNVEDRTNYCAINLSFRSCFFVERLLNKKSSFSAYNNCAYGRNFLNEKERELFEQRFSHHPNFSFLKWKSR
jgi:cytochrome P450